MKTPKIDMNRFSPEELLSVIRTEGEVERDRIRAMGETLLGSGKSIDSVSPEIAERITSALANTAKEGDGTCGTAGCC